MTASSSDSTPDRQTSRRRPIAPWSRFALWRREKFQRDQSEVRAYLEAATPIGLRAEREYYSWRDAVAEPVQDGQKAANASATFWWRVTEGLRRFEALTPPAPARKYHKLFAQALRSGSLGSEAAKNGFRAGKTYEVSRGLGYLDDFVKQMEQAEKELGMLVLKYKLLEEPIVEDLPESEQADDGGIGEGED